MIDEVLSPAMADGDVVTANIRITTAGFVFSVHDDHWNSSGMGFSDDLGQAAWIRSTGHNSPRFGGNSGSNRFLVGRNITAME